MSLVAWVGDRSLAVVNASMLYERPRRSASNHPQRDEPALRANAKPPPSHISRTSRIRPKPNTIRIPRDEHEGNRQHHTYPALRACGEQPLSHVPRTSRMRPKPNTTRIPHFVPAGNSRTTHFPHVARESTPNLLTLVRNAPRVQPHVGQQRQH